MGPEPPKPIPEDEEPEQLELAMDGEANGTIDGRNTEEPKSSPAPEASSSKNESVPPPSSDAPKTETDPTKATHTDNAKSEEVSASTDGENTPSGPSNAQDTDQAKAKVEEELPKQEVAESKDWLELPMLEKLDTLYLLTEWQFENTIRVRTIMKSNDENASWVSRLH